MDRETFSENMRSTGQEHLFHLLDKLTLTQKSELYKAVAELDLNTLKQQQNLLLHSPKNNTSIEPFNEVSLAGNISDEKRGKTLISMGKVGCLLVAGGEGTRLGFELPKGMVPVSKIKQKSLFQIFAEKVVAASKQANRLLPLAIMTSPLNDAQTKDYFKENNNFGLDPRQLFFFTQVMLPLLDVQGKLILNAEGQIARGPDGNGGALTRFVQSGIWDIWNSQGVEYVNFALIDNLLGEPFDPEFVGFQNRLGLDVAIKCIRREKADEKVGILVKKEGKTSVVEYTEFPEEERSAKDEHGHFKFGMANISLFCFSMPFVLEASKISLPLHLAFKSNAWKFERFIFDVLPIADKVGGILYPREFCFSPLKNRSGDNSIESVQNALQLRDKMVFTMISGKEPASNNFELAQDFYYPTDALLNKWKGKALPSDGYIES